MSILTSDILAQFQHLQQSGMLGSIETLKQENKELRRSIDDISQLISYTDVDAMLGFLVSKILDYFIPQTMLFLIKPPRKETFRQYFYRQLIRTNESISESCFIFFKAYFDGMEGTVQNGIAYSFSEILEKCPSWNLPEDFLALNPSLVIPLSGIGGVYGLVIMSDKIVGNAYSEPEKEYMHRIFLTLSITLQNGLHYETSITDAKTHLYTYDYFVTRINDTIATIHRSNKNAGMLMLDIDFFKKFNDTWGHLTGDKILAALALTVQKTVRDNDCAARFGGEEFSILVAECTEDTLFAIAERVRLAISNIELNEHGEQLSITVSIGGCLITPISTLTARYIFKKADQALYYSKSHGRNQSTILKMGLLDRASLQYLQP